MTIFSKANSLTDREFSKFTSNSNDEVVVRVILSSGTDINPLAKYVQAIYSNGDKTVTYNYYESASKVTLYNTITSTYSKKQNTDFQDASWT